MKLDSFIEVARKFEDLSLCWEISTKRDSLGLWVISAKHSDSKTYFEVQNKSLLKAMNGILDKMNEYAKNGS